MPNLGAIERNKCLCRIHMTAIHLNLLFTFQKWGWGVGLGWGGGEERILECLLHLSKVKVPWYLADRRLPKSYSSACSEPWRIHMGRLMDQC